MVNKRIAKELRRMARELLAAGNGKFLVDDVSSLQRCILELTRRCRDFSSKVSRRRLQHMMDCSRMDIDDDRGELLNKLQRLLSNLNNYESDVGYALSNLKKIGDESRRCFDGLKTKSASQKLTSAVKIDIDDIKPYVKGNDLFSVARVLQNAFGRRNVSVVDTGGQPAMVVMIDKKIVSSNRSIVVFSSRHADSGDIKMGALAIGYFN